MEIDLSGQPWRYGQARYWIASSRTTFETYRMDPKTREVAEEVKRGVYGIMSVGTVVTEIGGTLWVRSYQADRIGIFRYQAA
jgi:hypothetical protein